MGFKLFFRGFFGITLTILIIINMMYVFDLVGGVGVPLASNGEFMPNGFTFEDKYVGFTTFIEGFKTYFDDSILTDLKDSLDSFYGWIQLFSIKNKIMGLTFLDDVPTQVITIIQFLSTIVDIFFNFFYIIGLILYYYLYLVYILVYATQFVAFVFNIMSGKFFSKAPNTYGYILSFC